MTGSRRAERSGPSNEGGRRPVAAALIWGALGLLLTVGGGLGTSFLLLGLSRGLTPPAQAFLQPLALLGGVLFLRAAVRIWRRQN